ncbi:MAG: diguanylate cyclase [Cyanobacteria bacterium P01_A01_bin.114]
METSSLIAKLTQLQSELTSLHQPAEQRALQQTLLPSHQADLSQLVLRIRKELETIEANLPNASPHEQTQGIPFQAVLEQLPIAILLSDPKTGQYCWANSTFYDLLGYSNSQLHERVILPTSGVISSQPYIYEGSIQTQSGQLLSGRLTRIPIYDPAKIITYQITLIETLDRLLPQEVAQAPATQAPTAQAPTAQAPAAQAPAAQAIITQAIEAQTLKAQTLKAQTLEAQDTAAQGLLRQYQAQIKQQTQLRQTVQTIRQSLDRQTVFVTSAQEMGQFLKTDWVQLVEYDTQHKTWKQVTQYSHQEHPLPSFNLSEKLLKLAPLLKPQTPLHINLSTAATTAAYSVWLSHFPGSWLLLPIYLPAQPPERQLTLWGVMALGYRKFSAAWNDVEAMFAETIVEEVAIAIQQSLLYQQLQRANQELQALALTDGLTHIANRRRFDQHLANEWQRLTREQQPLSLILCDIDFFKRYNDHYGHPTGDRCLLKVAQSLIDASKRPADLVARYGGEEFAVILPNTHTTGAYRVAHKIRQGIADLEIPHPDSELSPWLTVTMGIATAVPSQELTAQELLQAADLALYHAKQQGRDRIYVHAHYTYSPQQETIDIQSQDPLDSGE